MILRRGEEREAEKVIVAQKHNGDSSALPLYQILWRLSQRLAMRRKNIGWKRGLQSSSDDEWI